MAVIEIPKATRSVSEIKLKDWDGKELESKLDIALESETEESLKEKFWYIVHNLIAHPLLITGKKWADRFHDWTANKFIKDIG